MNLDLHIAGRRPDGFHDLRTTVQSIELHDLLVLSPWHQTALEVDGLTVATHENSVLKAQQALERAAGRSLPAHFHLHKRIPPGSGMGGASSDAAAALRGLTALYRLDTDLAPIAIQVGADVPFFLHGGRAKAEGRGDRLTQLPDAEEWYAIAWPRIELSTAAVYRAWDEANEARGEAQNELRRAAERVDARVKNFAEHLGGGWAMTGSGSAFFKRCESSEEAVKAIGGLDAWTTVTRTVGRWA